MNGQRNVPLINGVEYSWADIVLNVNGSPITGFTKIDYADEQDMENIYAGGQYPNSRGYGNIKPTCSLTFLRGTIEALRAASPTGRLQDIGKMDVIVSFVPLDGRAVVTHKILNTEFTKDALNMTQGDLKNETDLPLLPSHIDWGNGVNNSNNS